MGITRYQREPVICILGGESMCGTCEHVVALAAATSGGRLGYYDRVHGASLCLRPPPRALRQAHQATLNTFKLIIQSLRKLNISPIGRKAEAISGFSDFLLFQLGKTGACRFTCAE